MLKISEWKDKESIRVYTRNSDFPFPMGPLSEPVQLFGMYYTSDGSLYVEHFAPADAIGYAYIENGIVVEQLMIPVTPGTKIKTSFHGSGEVGGLERAHSSRPRSHLGFSLQAISQPTLIAVLLVGGGGHYLGMFDTYKQPHGRSLVLDGLLETVHPPVFGLWVGPAGVSFPFDAQVLATTRELKDGGSLSIAVSLGAVPVEPRPAHPRLIARVQSLLAKSTST